jgi:hypothetical protein
MYNGVLYVDYRPITLTLVAVVLSRIQWSLAIGAAALHHYGPENRIPPPFRSQTDSIDRRLTSLYAPPVFSVLQVECGLLLYLSLLVVVTSWRHV